MMMKEKRSGTKIDFKNFDRTRLKRLKTKPGGTKRQTKRIEEKGDKGDFEILKEVGKGTFGVVHKAREIKTGKIVAIKKVYQDPAFKNRELQVLDRIQHSHCIEIHRYFFSVEGGKTCGKSYLNLVMDFYPKTLYNVIRYYRKKQMNFPNEFGKIYAYQIFKVLAYLRTLKVAHRDIKPQNILINLKNHKLVLCDFGSAKVIKQKQSSETYVCSRYYRAPELILNNSSYGTNVDIWSAGCVIAEMFLGSPLFMATDAKNQMRQIMKVLGTPTEEEVVAMNPKAKVRLPEYEKKDLMGEFRKGTDPLLVDLISKVLVYDPRKRLEPLRALLHPYFDELRESRLTVNGKELVDLFDFDGKELGGDFHLFGELVPNWWCKRRN